MPIEKLTRSPTIKLVNIISASELAIPLWHEALLVSRDAIGAQVCASIVNDIKKIKARTYNSLDLTTRNNLFAKSVITEIGARVDILFVKYIQLVLKRWFNTFSPNYLFSWVVCMFTHTTTKLH